MPQPNKPSKKPAIKKQKLEKKPKEQISDQIKDQNPVAKRWHHFVEQLHEDRSLKIMVILLGVLSIVVIATIVIISILKPTIPEYGDRPIPNINIEDTTDVIDDVSNIEKEEETPLVRPRHSDGVVVATEHANKVPACVMIENAAFSGVRPQSGLSAASVVYEVIVEGGITRWMAVFAGETANTVGPVRSARDTYLEFASEYNCAYAHAGGSYTALLALQEKEMRDLDGLRESKWFWRDPGKVSPHNFFTNTPKLEEAITFGHNWTDEPTYDVWNFVDDEALDKLEEESVNEVNIYFGGSYDVKYVYNKEENFYERWNGGALSTDANTGNALTTRNIIIQQVPEGIPVEGKGRINFSVTGEGVVHIFRNGQHVEGTWKKEQRLWRTKYYDENDAEIPLARGTSWIEIVPVTHTFDWKQTSE